MPQLQKLISVKKPAANTAWTITISSGLIWDVDSVFCTYEASADVGNRFVNLILSDIESITIQQLPLTLKITANQLARLTWGKGLETNSYNDLNNNTFQTMPMTPLIMSPNGVSKITSQVQGGFANDQFASIVLMVKETVPST